MLGLRLSPLVGKVPCVSVDCVTHIDNVTHVCTALLRETGVFRHAVQRTQVVTTLDSESLLGPCLDISHVHVVTAPC